MSKRLRPTSAPVTKGKRRTAKLTGHGTFTLKRKPKSKWVLNGAIT
jgi:hypothetical protein